MAATRAHGVWIDFRDLSQSFVQYFLSNVFLVKSISNDMAPPWEKAFLVKKYLLYLDHTVWIDFRDLNNQSFVQYFGLESVKKSTVACTS